jgi:Raf kinase inhibitor-like YbhB/YbcL family protein
VKKIIIFISYLVSFNTFAQSFSIQSSDLSKNGFTSQYIANEFGCNGENISPSLSWNDPPQGTKSFVITMYDQDAPTGSGWWHWVVANIPANVNYIVKNAGNNTLLLPKGSKAVRNDFGNVYYGGPCPPKGTSHRYIFTIYALSIEHINVSDSTSPALIGFIANTNLLGKATIMYNYQQ